MSMRQELLDKLAPWVEAQVCQYCPLVERTEERRDCPTGESTPSETTCPTDFEIGGVGCFHSQMWKELKDMVDAMVKRVEREL